MAEYDSFRLSVKKVYIKCFQFLFIYYLFINKSRDIRTCAALYMFWFYNKIMRFMSFRSLSKINSSSSQNAGNSIIQRHHESRAFRARGTRVTLNQTLATPLLKRSINRLYYSISWLIIKKEFQTESWILKCYLRWSLHASVYIWMLWENLVIFLKVSLM